MENPRHLRDTYRFPGFDPAASVHGYPGDPKAIILPLRRRRKKRSAASVDKPIKIRAIQRRAYGLRDEEYLRLKVLSSMLPKIKE